MVITDKYVLFWGEEFSNFFPARFSVKNRIFYCSEQYFMWKKALHFKDYETANKIFFEGKEPKIAKKLGRQVKNFNEESWASVRFEIMYEALYLKFSQNKDLKEKLLSYGDRTFVEASPYDKIWGIGLSENDELAKDSNNWLGLNLLGKALCMVRDFFNVTNKINTENSNEVLLDAINMIGIDKIVQASNDVEFLQYIHVKSAIDYYGITEILDNISTWEIVDEVGESQLLSEIDASDVVNTYTTNELLEEMNVEDIADYLRCIHYDVDGLNDTETLKENLKAICRTLKPRGVIDKKDMKELLNQFVDDNFFN